MLWGSGPCVDRDGGHTPGVRAPGDGCLSALGRSEVDRYFPRDEGHGVPLPEGFTMARWGEVAMLG